jgi:hypothetical protein
MERLVKNKIEAKCTWEDGPDILVKINVELDPVHSLDMTVQEAKDLIEDLTTAIKQAEELEETCKDSDKELKGK